MPRYLRSSSNLFYREQGRWMPLLILPGNTASSAVQAGELAYFGERYHAVALDLPGTGRSERIDAWPDDWWREGARGAVGLLDHLSVAQVVVMAQQALHRVRAVVADSCVTRQPPEVLRAEVASHGQRYPEAVAFWRLAHGEDWEQVVEADSDLMLRVAKRGGRWFDRSLSEIGCPVLLTGSLQDAILHDGAAQMIEMAEQIPESQLVLVNGGDHPLMWSRSEDFRRAVDAFLTSLRGGDGASGDV